MSTKIHSLIVNPKVTATLVCENGKLKHQIDEYLNFYGHLKFENCDAEQVFVTLGQAAGDMIDRSGEAHTKSSAQKDLINAGMSNYYSPFLKFMGTDLYKKWVGDRTKKEKNELRFQTYAKYFCGERYNGDKSHSLILNPLYFRKDYCPDKIDHTNYHRKPWKNFI